MDELITEFLTETNESLAELDNDLVQLEQNPNDTDLLSGIFRLMHTIKGTCGFLGLARLEKVAHKAEDVLGRFRDKELEVTEEYITLIFESVDAIKYIINEIEANGEEPAGDDEELIKKLEAAYEGKSLDQAEAPSEAKEASAGEQEDASDNEAEEAVDGDDTAVNQESASEKSESQGSEEGGAGDSSADINAGKAEEDPSDIKNKDEEAEEPEQKQVKESQLSSQTLRVSVDVLEDLMTMVSELVLTRNQLMQIMRNQRDTDFSGPLQNLNQVVSELQDGVMKTRMQPIGNAWAKLPRIVRDISLELGKKIELEMNGQETELDRQVLEMIKDPLTHMVRNSADHGIELPEERADVGKPETGKIRLNAYHEGGHIIIEIKDDGKGLAIDKIKKKVLANGLATEEELENMSGHQIQQFIFKAGFSTAEQVTAVSGRGVGMDVVRSNIENIGGSIELNSIEGKGTTFFIKIPLTLAIVSALIVEAAKEKFAIPQLAVRELVMATENGRSRIETIKGTPVFRLRDHLLPLVSLKKLLELKELVPKQQPEEVEESGDGKDESAGSNVTNLPHVSDLANLTQISDEIAQPSDHASSGDDQGEKSEDNKEGERSKEANVINLEEQRKKHKSWKNRRNENSEYIVVTQVGSYQFGIIVDQVYDTEEIVVKPVSKILRDIDLFSGNTILGDGSVIMILDPAGIAKTTGEVDSSESAADDRSGVTDKEGFQGSKTSLLLFKAADTTPKAVPLSLVARLENIKGEDVEFADNQMLVQYRGQLMPLVPLSSSTTLDEGEEKPVLVFSTENKSMGLVVDEILDILEAHIDVQYSSGNKGVIGSAIVNEKATDIIDVSHYIQKSDSNWFNTIKTGQSYEGGKDDQEAGARRVLLIDDSPFFRNMMAPLLSVAGYEVTSLESAVEALELLEQGEQFDVIVSDIEMPDMSGFEFAEKIRSNSDYSQTPLVALSSHATADDINRGEEAGFQKYVAKFDRETLLSTINETVGTKVDDDEDSTGGSEHEGSAN